MSSLRQSTDAALERLERLPEWLRVGGFLLIISLISLYVRTRFIGGQFWMDEAIAVGIASHSLSAIPHILRADGSPPLYYVLLHFWMTWFGNTTTAVHAMSLVFGMATIPAGYWAGRTLIDKRAGLVAAVMFASSAFITQYSQEGRMYSLMVLLGLLATIGFVKAFVHRERRYAVLFVLAEVAMLYTHAWGVFFGGASFVALALLYWRGDQEFRGNLIKDTAFSYGAIVLLFLPWLPTLLYQAGHTAAPWDVSPRFGAPIQISRNVLGGDQVTAPLVIATVVGLAQSVVGVKRYGTEAKTLWIIAALFVFTLAFGWIASQITPAWVPRYFAPVVPAMLLVIAVGVSRSGLVGVIAVIFMLFFLSHPSIYSFPHKSDMQQISGELGPMLHKGDLVIVGQPESTPLAYYYLPGGLRYANTIGPVKDPSYMNWVNALKRYQDADPWKVAPPLLNSLRKGQQLLFIRPLTEGLVNWQAPWSVLVRRRSAQWSAIIAADKQLVPEAVAPDDYLGACCIADSAILYKKN
jgi:mannosyltransferase